MAANSMSEIFSLISLHQEEINDKSFTLKTKNRCIVTAIILDYILTQKMDSENDKLLSNHVLCLLWLMMQSNDSSKIYSFIESDAINKKYMERYESDQFAHSLLDNSIKTNGASGWNRLHEPTSAH